MNRFLLHRVAWTAFALSGLLGGADAIARDKPSLPFDGPVNVIVHAVPVPDGGSTADNQFNQYYLQYMYGPLVGGALGAADSDRAKQAAAELAPTLKGFDLTPALLEEIERSLARELLGASVTVKTADLGLRMERLDKKGIDGRALLIWPTLSSGHNFAQLFVELWVSIYDPDTFSRWTRDGFKVVYEVRFPELSMGESRVENARRIASLGAERVVPALSAAIPELVAMANHELQIGEGREEVGELRQQPLAEGGRSGMRVVRRSDDRIWLRERMMGNNLSLYSVAALKQAPAR